MRGCWTAGSRSSSSGMRATATSSAPGGRSCRTMRGRGVPPEALPYGMSMPDAVALHLQRRRRRRIALAVGVFFLVVFLLLCYVGVFGGNVRTVVPGQVYRSGQLTGNGIQPLSAQWVGHSLDNVLRSRHIRTVVNLR